MRFLIVLLVALVPISLVSSADVSFMHATHLRCEYLDDPIGIGETKPRLSWWCESKTRGDQQTAYQILVASTPALLKSNKGDLWDTGPVESNQSTQIEYDGGALKSREAAFWKVRLFDKDGHASDYSNPAKWEIGLLNQSDWKATWAGLPPPDQKTVSLHGGNWIWFPEGNPAVDAPVATRYFRATFAVDDVNQIKNAELWTAVDDDLTAYLNGVKLGTGHGYKYIASFPLKSLLRNGQNVVAIEAANTGGPAAVTAVVDLERQDGSHASLMPANTTWLSSDKETSGWQSPGFDTPDWQKAIVVGEVGKEPWPDPRLQLPEGRATYLRKDFEVQQDSVASARIYASAKGLYNLYVDGKRVSQDVFDPGWTDYTKRIQYQTFDVTDQLKPGEHTIGAVLGDGWYVGSVGWGGRGQYGRQPMCLVQLEITYKSGKKETVPTGPDWQVGTGPILASDMMNGETYDARKELANWCMPKAPGQWDPARAEALGNVPLVSEPSEPVAVWNEIHPKKITRPRPGVLIYDLGQNMVGWARLRVKGKAGDTVQLRFAEVLNPDGTIYTDNLRTAKATDTYTLKGDGEEVYEPSFTFHGFRYVEVTGYPGTPGTDAITGVVVGSNMAVTGSFECSNAMVNQLQHNIYWGQRGNYLSVPTDCPQRDERLGWMGDAEIFAKTATFNCNIAPFMTKWLADVRDGQSEAGGFADVSPRILMGGDGAPAWGDAGVIVPWNIYLAYGDTRILERSYPSMQRWVEYIHAANPDLLWENSRNNDYGDWLSIKADTPKDVLATAFFAHSTDILAQTADILGHKEDAERYHALYEGIKDAYIKAFVSLDGKVKGETQTGYLLSLAFNLMPDHLRAKAAQYLVDDITKNHGGNLSTGFLGVKYLAPTLTQMGHQDLAYKLLLNDTFPSWGYSIKQGATTIWERWDGYTKEKGFQDPGMNSFNHYSLGSIGEWIYSIIGGLESSTPGWKTFTLHPQPGGGVTWAKTGFDSPQGHIQCDWQRSTDGFSMNVTVPTNTTAEVWIPAASEAGVNENNKPVSQAQGVTFKGMSTGYAVFSVGGGKYAFRS